MFLGARMWSDRQAPPSQVQVQPVRIPQQVEAQVKTVPVSDDPIENKATEAARTPVIPAKSRDTEPSASRRQTADEKAVATTIDRQGFVPLMFCDPLICSGDEQVIRMELPSSGTWSADGNGGQPVIADVVVGDDGLVRAMRIVN
jgi:hypothetical protein